MHPVVMLPRKRTALAARFWLYVDRLGPDECWPWTGAQSAGDGRGYIGLGGGSHRMMRASRIALALACDVDPDAIPSDFFVCHTCDNPNCVNPAHLYVGTALDNAQDCVKRGRGRGKLSCSQREAVVAAYRRNEGSTRKLGQRFGVTGATVAYWLKKAGVAPGRDDRDKLSPAQRAELVLAYRRGEGSTRALARRFKVSGPTVVYWLAKARALDVRTKS